MCFEMEPRGDLGRHVYEAAATSQRRPIFSAGRSVAPDRAFAHSRLQSVQMLETPLPDLILYGRPGCHLCEETRMVLATLLADRREQGLATPTLIERDIESDPAWHRAFMTTIPVVEVGERRLELATSPAKLRRLLADAYDGPEGPIDR
jgi:hypothetical protein